MSKPKPKPKSKSKSKQKEEKSETSSVTTEISEITIKSDEESEHESEELDETEKNDSDCLGEETDNNTNKSEKTKQDVHVYDNIDANSDDEREYEQHYDDDNKIYDEYIDDSQRITFPILTKYERVRILCDRAKHLSCGAKPMIQNYQHLDSKQIAEEELKHGVIPFIIVRTLPNGKKEKWRISELQIIN